VSGEPVTTRVWLLGGFHISVGDRIVRENAWRLSKSASLVKLLALCRGHRLHRDQAMNLLWPKLDPRAAANNLYYALHHARRTLDPEGRPAASRHLLLRGKQLMLCPEGELWVDVKSFGEASAAARRAREPSAYRAALDLYTGELLPQDRYEEWAQERREELRGDYLALLAELAALHEERGEFGEAIEALSRVMAEEPSNEQAHVGLMRLYALAGRRQEALRQYERLEGMLSRGFGRRPDAEGRHLYEEILAERLPLALPPHGGGEGRSSEDLGGRRHNLPAALSSFVGREGELVEVKRALAMTRLLTLTGAGGCGKTRLALEVARDLASSYPDGVWLVELASLSQPELVPQAAASVLGVREQPDRPLVDTLVGHLREKDLLLILDNCEHLIEVCAQLGRSLLHSCPRLRVLATSREPLGVKGEALRRVSSLSVPDTDRLPAAGELTRYDAVRLFVDRARLRVPDFELTPKNGQTVAQVCGRLEGIPLAIELATARVGALAVEEMAQRLEDSLSLLSAGSRTAEPRHRTMRATLEWSHGLLSEPEKELFRRLSAFAGGWTLEAAEAVGSGGLGGGADVLDLLTRLLDKSMAVAEATEGGRVRYRMLEPIRQYARKKLEEDEESDAVLRRHANLFLALAEEAEPELRGTRQQEWLERLEAEHDNFRAALSWALEGGEPELALRLAGALGDFWQLRGRLKEGRRWLEATLAEGSEFTTIARVKALIRAGDIAMEQRSFERAVTLSEEGLALSRGLGDEVGAAASLFNLGMVALLRNDSERAVALLEEAVKLAHYVGNVAALSLSVHGLALAFMHKYDLERAAALQRENLARARESGDQHILSMSIGLGGLIALGEGDYERAEAHGLEALKMFRRMDLRQYIPTLLQLLAAAAGRGDPLRSARLRGASEALHEAMGARLSAGEHAYFEPHLAAARAQLDKTTWETAWAEGRAMTFEQAVEYVLSADEPAPAEIVTPEDQWVDEPPDSPLTRREREVADLIGRGLTNRQISSELSISKGTVENHVHKILVKLKLRSRTQIAAWAARRELLS
jgi:predicted ATPase/DNA-binding SARP family transcriptional activator/DNA-binding CsgD family transcriptional regulator